MPTQLAKVPDNAVCVVERYGSAKNFLIVMSPAAQSVAAMNPDEVYRSAYTITKVRLAFGSDVVKSWIMAHLENLNDYTGVKEKIKIPQMLELAGIIAADYGYLKAAEILLFFHLLKKGAFGPLYGSVDPLLIANALCQYDNERQAVITRIQAEDNQKRLDEQREHSSANSITREEYLRRRKANRRQTFVELSRKKTFKKHSNTLTIN